MPFQLVSLRGSQHAELAPSRRKRPLGWPKIVGTALVRIACSLWLFAAAIAGGQERSFIACPIVRDTKTVPCFLAEYEGEIYYLGIQQDITAAFHPPQLKHEVLVEGHVSEGPRICGGIPLAPLSISCLAAEAPAAETAAPRASPSLRWRCRASTPMPTV